MARRTLRETDRLREDGDPHAVGGALNPLLLLLRSSEAYYPVIAALVSVALAEIHTLDVLDSTINFTSAEKTGYILMSFGVAAFLIS
jgi:hypothetical protein